MNPNQIRTRIYNVVPAATWQMDELLSLLDIVLDESIPSACVDCSVRPRLRLNPSFIADYCRTDEHLLMLVLHELHHVVLGHTRLFQRPTRAHNIAFDAVINAILCQQFREERYWSFFTGVNSAKDFPARLLRPPVGWPDRLRIPADASEKEKRIIQLLYGNSTVGATYLEVFELLVESLKGDAANNCVLIGNHADDSDLAESDPFFGKAIRDIVSKWPRPDRILSGRDQGSPSEGYQLESASTPSDPLRRAFEKILRQAGIHTLGGSSTLRPALVQTIRAIETVVPQPRDRRIPSWKALHGAWPVIYRGFLEEKRIQRAPLPVAHVYLDISGSMTSHLPKLTAALRRPHKLGLLRLFVFSTVVGEVEPRNLTCKLPNTFGTDINCVLEHLDGITASKRPRRAVVVTDGWVGTPAPAYVERLAAVRFFAAIAGDDRCDDLKSLNIRITKLPI